MAWTSDGLINLVNGTKNVVGVGTSFLTSTKAGEALCAPDGRWYEIDTISSNTALTLKLNYNGSTANGQSYSIAPLQGYLRDLATQASTIINSYSSFLSGVGAGKFADGTVSAPGISFSADQNSGFYRIGADNIGLSLNGAKVVDFATTGVSITGTLSASKQGGAGDALTWTSTVASSKTGYLYAGANSIGFFDTANGAGTGVYAYQGNSVFTQVAGSNIVSVTAAGQSITGSLNTSTGIQVKGSTVPTSGASLELHYGLTANAASILAYDRTGAAYRDIILAGSTISLRPGGTQAILVSSGTVAITGTLSVTSSLTGTSNSNSLGNSSGSSVLTLGTASPSGNGTGGLQFINSNSATNWLIGCNYNVSGVLEITPSTVAGGSTFTTAVAKFSTTGLALTGTLSATGQIKSTANTDALVVQPSSGTNGAYATFTNSGGSYYVGADNSTGSSFGATAYALVRYAPTGRVIQDIIAATPITTVSASGLSVTGTLSATGALSLTTGASNHFIKEGTGWAWSSTGASGGTVRGGIYGQSTGVLSLWGGVTPSAHFNVDANGNLGLALTPNAWNSTFKVMEGNSGALAFRASNGGLELWQNAYFNGSSQSIYTTTAAASRYAQQSGAHSFQCAASGTAGGTITWTPVFAIEKAKSVALEGATTQAGTGISFPATQSACSDANTLDDYEEGTFTPVISGTSTAGAGTYTTQVGRYTKIGNKVSFSVHIVTTAHTGTGNLSLSGLPFTAAVTPNTVCAVYASDLALTAGNVVQAYVNQNNSTISIHQVPSGGGAVAAIPMDAAFTILISGTYFV